MLKEVARRLQSLLREHDAVVRWAGEEFLLVLQGTPVDALPAVAGRVLQAVGGTPVRLDGGIEITLNVSAGCVSWPAQPGQSWQDALHVADLALYLSKSGGRNRVTCLMGAAPGASAERMPQDLAAARTAAVHRGAGAPPHPARRVGGGRGAGAPARLIRAGRVPTPPAAPPGPAPRRARPPSACRRTWPPRAMPAR